MKRLLVITILVSCLSYGMQHNGNYCQKKSAPQCNASTALLQMFASGTHKKIVDVRCGPGDIAAWIAEHAPEAEVVGVDPNQTMIIAARQAHFSNKKLSFLLHDAQREFPFKDHFDLAFSSATFLSIHNKEAAFDNVHKILKPNGQMFIITTLPLAAKHPLKRTLEGLAGNPKWASLVQAWQANPEIFPLSLEEADRIITTEKWNNIIFEEMRNTFRFKDKQELSKWMLGWMKTLTLISALSSYDQKNFMQDFSDEYVKTPGIIDGDGNITYLLHGLLIKAQKK